MRSMLKEYFDSIVDEGICDVELIKHLQRRDVSERLWKHYQELLWKRYGKMAGSAWNILCAQLPSYRDLLDGRRDSFLSDAMATMYESISKIDLNKIYSSSWHFSHYYNWMLQNLRKTWRAEIIRCSALASLSFNPITDEEGNGAENEWLESQAYELGNIYDTSTEFEEIDAAIDFQRAINKCMGAWNAKKRTIYRYLVAGKSRAEIAGLLGYSYPNISLEIHNMYKDVKKEIA